MFRRRRRGEADDESVDDVAVADDAVDAPDEPEDGEAIASPPGRPQGPWDHADAPEDGRPRVDLGAVHVPLAEGMEMRLDVQDEVIVSATLVDGHSMLQVHAFAAPRSSGIWADVRTEIAESLRQSGGEAQDEEGPFGTELRARIPVEAPGQGPSLQPARFIGVDGPRWFLRGMMTGPASTDPVQAKRLEEVFRGTVVARGGEAMAPRELLPLRLPRDAVEQAPAAADRSKLEIFERGPEITEIQ
ncbi:MAG TPA: DUF3710 domain-containing protein [Mycobacteriales bacterium]|nr:DUF3710 domain-containing protein [Mycobacteriales bacterium]